MRLPNTFDGHFNFEPETISFRKFEQGSAVSGGYMNILNDKF